mgnify:CR=1 FL=1
MGYSMTAKAAMVMDTFKGDGASANVWTYRGQEYFWERGRENRDGAMTGSVISMTGYRKGSYKIAADGHIERAPCGLRERLNETVGLANYYKAHEPRVAWEYACQFDGIPREAWSSPFICFSPENPYA